MKKTAIIGLSTLSVLTLGYFAGPKPAPPAATLSVTVPAAPTLTSLQRYVDSTEQQVPGLKPGNAARIVWADSTQPQKTPIALLYVHGFSASHEEGAPVHTHLAKAIGANLFLTRLEEHGIDRPATDDNMLHLTADNYMASAEKAFQIATQLGDSVLIVGTSAGGALGLYLAARHTNVKGLILYDPCIEILAPGASLLAKPWGAQLATLVKQSKHNTVVPENELQARYWTMHYRLEATVALQNFLTHTMTPETFGQIKVPVFLGYYYKSETEQDPIVSVPAMLTMFDQLGTPPARRQKMAFPTVGHHVMASYVLSKDWEGVEKATLQFIANYLQ